MRHKKLKEYSHCWMAQRSRDANGDVIETFYIFHCIADKSIVHVQHATFLKRENTMSFSPSPERILSVYILKATLKTSFSSQIPFRMRLNAFLVVLAFAVLFVTAQDSGDNNDYDYDDDLYKGDVMHEYVRRGEGGNAGGGSGHRRAGAHGQAHQHQQVGHADKVGQHEGHGVNAGHQRGRAGGAGGQHEYQLHATHISMPTAPGILDPSEASHLAHAHGINLYRPLTHVSMAGAQ